MKNMRLVVIAVFFCLAFGAAVGRLAELQFYRSDELVASLDSRLRHAEQKAPRRGRILDADGGILAEDQPTHDLWIVPARREHADGGRRYVSNFPPLTMEQLTALAANPGQLERELAVKALAEGNQTVQALAERTGGDRSAIAGKVLQAILLRRPASIGELLEPRLAIEDVDFTLALEIRSARANPFTADVWRGAEMRIGGKRRYPHGRLFAHVTGYVGKLSPEDYLELRGGWDGDEKIPGSGVIVRQGREFFSVLSKDANNPVTDEELIIRLREVKRDGRMVRSRGYFVNETVGRGGLEQYYNQALRGRHVVQRLRLARDAGSGRRHFQPLGGVEKAKNGADVRISLRLDFQRQAYEILEKHIRAVKERHREHLGDWQPAGVAIMLDPRNGRILSFVNFPAYDPNTIGRDFADLLEDPAIPLLNRAVSGIYPPGSIVKPLVGLAAQAEGAVMPGQRFHCDGAIHLAGARFTCLGRHGDMDLESALMRSCNVFFYHAGGELGSRGLYEWYMKAGVGRKAGIDIAGEVDGVVPRAAYTGKGWATGNTYHLAIGQGMAVTPLQIAVMYAALANSDGKTAKIVRPHFLIPPPGFPATPEEEELALEAMRLDEPVAEVAVDGEALAAVRHGMWKVIQGNPEGYDRETGGRDYGTGVLASFPTPDPNSFLLEWAGKTGTAEWSRVVDGAAVKQISHVWFAGYAPYDRPEVVVVVLLPGAGGGGGGTCAPIAKDLVRLWFNLPERAEHVVAEEGALG